MAGEQLLLPSQEALLHRLQHLACYGEQLVLLEGEKGAGKTTLLTALANGLDDCNLALVACPQYATAGEIRRKIIMQLLPDPLFDDEAPLADTLLRFIPELHTPLHILVDDAEYLPLTLWAECLLLTQLQCAGATVTLTLAVNAGFGQQLLPQLPKPQRQWLLPVTLEPLSLPEREGLYQTLLTRSQQPVFTPRSIVIKQLEQQSGTPAAVLQLVQLALDGTPSARKTWPWRRLTLGLLLVVLLLSSAIWYIGKWMTPLPQQPVATLVIHGDYRLPDTLWQWLPIAYRPTAAPIAPDDVAPLSPLLPALTSPAVMAAHQTVVAPNTAPVSESKSTLLEDAAATADVVTADIPTSTAPAAVEIGQASAVSAAENPVAAAPEQSVTVEPAITVVGELPKRGYTLQLVSMKQRASANEYLTALYLKAPAGRTDIWLCRHGQWWVILQGNFTSRQQALTAAQNWQQETGEQAWIRAWKAIQGYQPQPLP
ncbi:AAA family ATPase [Shewanella sp. YIC-542]|uniref:AAA family ATPase n=1 Tax=Shewanella mytili TaxID=3377111 RepID=UPI00398E973B